MFSTRPRIGTRIMFAMFTALPTTIWTRSWGLETITTPSMGSDWNTVSATSEVPGGMSTRRKSMSPQMVSE